MDGTLAIKSDHKIITDFQSSRRTALNSTEDIK